jgi:hypothetical protein
MAWATRRYLSTVLYAREHVYPLCCLFEDLGQRGASGPTYVGPYKTALELQIF